MDEILQSLAGLPGVQGAALMGKDGLVIASSGEVEPDVELVGATTAEYFSHIENGLGSQLERGDLQTVTIEASGGRLFLKAVNDSTFLLVAAGDSVNLGLVRHQMRHAVEQLREQL